MSAPDLALAQRFLTANPPPGRLMLCAVTGSHIYGFTSPDSDIDLKGIHLAPIASLLGLSRPAETHDRLMVFEGVECDLTTHEIGNALAWMLRGNGNMLERLLSPIQVVDTPWLTDLARLAQGSLSIRSHRHYAGFFKNMQRESQRQKQPRAKTLLYGYRVALTGVHLLLAGQVRCDLPFLAREYGFPEVAELIALKASTTEKATLQPQQAERYRAVWPVLEEKLSAAKKNSQLPRQPLNQADCEDWLIQMRLRER